MFKDEKAFGEQPDRPDLSKPTLAGLVYLLRNLPDGWGWDYTSCPDCAMGVATEQWEPESRDKLAIHGKYIMQRMFNLSDDDVHFIFFQAASFENNYTPLPKDVADLIDGVGTPAFRAKREMARIMVMMA